MIFGDFETRSYADLKQVGVWPYSEDQTTGVICFCYAIDDGPVRDWWPDIPGIPKWQGEANALGMPWDLALAIEEGQKFEAHNVAFEYAIWNNIMVPRYGWSPVGDDRWRDNMASASYYAMPAALERLSRALGRQGKDAEGGRLITRYSKLHLKTAKPDIAPDDFAKFVAYCRQDVIEERAISNYLGDLPERELPIFQLDLLINQRGIYLDAEGIEAATAVVDARSEQLEDEFMKLTGVKPTQRDKCMAWFAEQGVRLENMQAEYLEELLEDGDISQGPARRALEIRLQINKASTKKLDAMARQRGSDGRARFQVRYHGAATGRWTGGGFQPLNLNRGFGEDVEPDALVSDIMHRDPAWLDCIYGDAMDAVAKASRHWIMAGEGHRIIAGDFVSIEAVILACLAGEQWKIEAFRSGAKIYEMMADKIYNLPPGTVTKKTHPLERQDGKTGELAFGYQGALNAWLNFDSSGRHSDEKIIEICKSWRREHPATVRFWRDLEDAAIEAVRSGKLTACAHGQPIAFEAVDEWLSMILPDGKRIWYREPQLHVKMPRWHQPAIKPECASGDCDCKAQPQLTYMAMKTGQWKRVSTYGGKLCENATQATSRQVLVPAMMRAEAAGYPIVLSVYDEIVSEVANGHGSKDEFAALMRECPGDWAKGWPIGVDCWEGDRYRK